MDVNVIVRGYMKPTASFHTLTEWEDVVHKLLELQRSGVDTRGGLSPDQRLVDIVEEFFGYRHR